MCLIHGLSHDVKNTDCVFQNVALRGIFGPKSDELKEDGVNRKIIVFRSSYCLPDIIRIIKRRRIGWEKHVATVQSCNSLVRRLERM